MIVAVERIGDMVGERARLTEMVAEKKDVALKQHPMRGVDEADAFRPRPPPPKVPASEVKRRTMLFNAVARPST